MSCVGSNVHVSGVPMQLGGSVGQRIDYKLLVSEVSNCAMPASLCFYLIVNEGHFTFDAA